MCAGIYWEKLSPEKLCQIRVLRELEARVEQETGTKLPCGPSSVKLPQASKEEEEEEELKCKRVRGDETHVK